MPDDTTMLNFGGPVGGAQPFSSPFMQNPQFSSDPFGRTFAPLSTLPEASAYSAALEARRHAPLVDGTVLTDEELADDKYGAKLLAIRSRTTKYGFTDAMFHGSAWDFVPFMGMFATVGNDISAARDASNAYQKMLRGEALTRDEAIRTTLWEAEQDMRANGEWGAMFGEIVRKAPSFMVEMGALGKAGEMLRSAASTSALKAAAKDMTPEAVEKVAFLSTTRAAKSGAADLAGIAVRSAAEAEVARGAFPTLQAAAKALSKSPEFISSTAKTVSDDVTGILFKSAPELTKVNSWAPGLAGKVSETMSERAVKASLATLSKDTAVGRWFSAAGRAVKDTAIEGLIDFGRWSNAASVPMTASKSFAQAALDFTVFAGTRGAVLFAPREAVNYGVGELSEALTGRKPVRQGTLGIQQAAWQTRDEGLMDRAETYGLMLDLLEYVSENSGRGFNNMMRGIGLSAAPRLMNGPARIAGSATPPVAAVQRDAANKIVGATYDSGLFDPARSAQAGGVIRQYVDKILADRSVRGAASADRLTAVVHKLEKSGIQVGDKTALQAAIESGSVGRGLSPEIASAIGRDMNGYVKVALKEARKEIQDELRTHGFMTYFVADFAGRHNFDARQVYDAFHTMGYDGILAEMSEERYVDVITELFGIDAKHDTVWNRIKTALVRTFWPEGGLKQLSAEALGFAVPAVSRIGISRMIASMGSANDYSSAVAASGYVGDLLRYGSIQEFERGDYLQTVADQVERLNTQVAQQQTVLDAGQVDGVPLTEQQKSDIQASIEGFRRGASRAETASREFLASLGDDSGRSFFAPVYSDESLVAESAEFEQHLHATAAQARKAMDAYREVVAFAPKWAQLTYKSKNRMADESKSGFRKISGWVVRHALGLAGFASTGEIAFLSANPAMFSAVDRGVEQHLMEVLSDRYGKQYESVESRMRHESEDGTVDTEAAHAQALEEFRGEAEEVMAEYLAAMNVHVYSSRELADLAMSKVAEEEGYLVDARHRELLGSDMTAKSYDRFMRESGIKERVDGYIEQMSRTVFDQMTRSSAAKAESRTDEEGNELPAVYRYGPDVMAQDLALTDVANMVRGILDIPAGLPTAQQAVLETVLRHSPATRGNQWLSTVKRVDPSKYIDSQVGGIEVNAGPLRTIADLAVNGREINSAEDFENIVRDGAEHVDAGALEVVGRALGYFHNFTDKSLVERNRKVIRYALQAMVLDNPDTALFARSYQVSEEDNGEFAAYGEDVVFARRNPDTGMWSVSVKRADDRSRVDVVESPTLDGLAEAVAADEYGYERRARRILHTMTGVLYSDSAQDFVHTMNLSDQYMRLMYDAMGRYTETGTDQNVLDPALRVNSDGTPMFDEDQAEQVRRQEAREAADYLAHAKQGRIRPGEQPSDADVALYLNPGERVDDAAAMDRARARMQRAYASYYRREGRTDDGHAIGYNAVAVDLARKNGVVGGEGFLDNELGVFYPQLRNKFTLNLQNFSLRNGGDIYISINHASAQSYSSSILSAAVGDALRRGAPVLRKLYAGPVKSFLKEVDKLVQARIDKAHEEKDRAREDKWRKFGAMTVSGVADGSRLSISFDTVSRFIQAFCLYRTEVPRGELLSTLGEYGQQYADIAREARQLPSYAGFYAAADFALGGSGLDLPSRGTGRGLAYFYNRFAPGTKEARDAVKNDMDPGAREEFEQKVRNIARQVLKKGASESGTPETPPSESPARTDPGESAVVQAARSAIADIAEELGRTDGITAEESAEVAAAIGGGETADVRVQPPVEGTAPSAGTSETSSSETSGTHESSSGETLAIDEDDAEDGDDSVYGADDFLMLAPAKPVHHDENGDVLEPDYRELKDLTKDEMNAFGEVLARVAGMAGAEVTEDFLRSMTHNRMSDEEIAGVMAAYEAGGKAYEGDEEWAMDERPDDEGVTPDGVEHNGLRNVELIRGPLVRRMLAIISRVSPATGRDFQPFCEDLRASVAMTRDVFADQLEARPILADALVYLDKFLNPRANNDFDNPCDRESAHAELVEWLRPPRRGYAAKGDAADKWTAVKAYVGEFARTVNGRPVNARAAFYLAYLMSLPGEARQQLARLVANAAPAVPVELATVRDPSTGDVSFRIDEVDNGFGKVTIETMTSALSWFSGKPKEELSKAADALEGEFRAEVERAKSEGWSGNLSGNQAHLHRVSRHGLFDVYARVFAKAFGMDNPLAAVFTSRRLAVFAASMDDKERARKLGKFSVDADGLSYAVKDLLYEMRAVVKATAGDKVDRETLDQATVSMFESGSPMDRHIHRANASAMGMGAWGMLVETYSRAKPVSVMRAKIDSARTNKPSSSLAITMPGIEPALQNFLDNPGEKTADGKGRDGFLAVCRKFFPEAAARKDFDIGVLRQRLEWPDRDGTLIVAKNVLKTSYADEVYDGARATYDGGSRMLYVPVYSGDHMSSIIVQVPVAERLRSEGVSYDDAAKMVSEWLGLDLFGDDAKRSAYLCVEAPGFSLRGFRKDARGEYIYDNDGNPEMGRVTYAYFWNSAADGHNDAFLGTEFMYGYGARRARELAREPALSSQKLHIMPVAPEPGFGDVMPELAKGLVTCMFGEDDELHGKFLDNDPKKLAMDFAKSMVRDEADTCFIVDGDSAKLDLTNSKIVGVQVSGKTVPIKDFVLETVLRGAIADAGEKLKIGKSGLSGDELDKMCHDAVVSARKSLGLEVEDGHEGEIPLVNLAKGEKPEWVKLSGLLPGARITEVADGIYAFSRDADNLMAFQVANVAHKARASQESTATNLFTDYGTIATLLADHNADSVSGTSLFHGRESVVRATREYFSTYGLLASAIVSDGKSVQNLLDQDEEWQAMLAAKIPTNGRIASGLRRKIYSAWVSDVKTPPLRGFQAALTSNGAWIDEATGEVRCHSRDQMFVDTLRGARTVAKKDREFVRAAHRVALANVNCTDDSFRHGLYIDEVGLLKDGTFDSYGFIPKAGTMEDWQRVVVTLENVVGHIVDGCTMFGSTEEEHHSSELELRRILGQYLLDHHGGRLSDRFYVNKKGEAVFRYERVGFLDLFTRATGENGSLQFDRSAVYRGMHDSTGAVRMYLGGTKLGFPRTPSYNAHIVSMRAALPVTETTVVHKMSDGATSEQWSAGADGYVAPDPYTLKILGNDNDGDKSFLYMLDQKNPHMVWDDGEEFAYGLESLQKMFDAATMAEISDSAIGGDRAPAKLVEWRRSLVERGVLVREAKRAKAADGSEQIVEGKLVLSSRARARLGNMMALGLFDMDAMVPVYDETDAEVPMYAGIVHDGTRKGDMNRGVRAAVAADLLKDGEPESKIPEKTRDKDAAWDAALDEPGVMSEKVLDAKNPKKWLSVGKVAAKVQTGGALVSAARARFVAASRNLHILRFAGLPYGVNGAIGDDAAEFIDVLYHLDGPSNMSFDDMKGQKCSRIGFLPGMIDTFLADYAMGGALPSTDAAAVGNAKAFAKKCNDPSHMYHWMMRASNPADTEFQNELNRLKLLPEPDWNGLTAEKVKSDPLLLEIYNLYLSRAVMLNLDKPEETALRSAAYAVRQFNSRRPLDPGVGALYWARQQADAGVASVYMIDWLEGVSAVRRGNSVADAINYTYVDPGERATDSGRDSKRKTLRGMIERGEISDPLVLRMGAAVQLLTAGPGDFAMAHGVRSVENYSDNYKTALDLLPDDGRTYASRLLLAASASSRLRKGDRIRAANNAHMVLRAAALFAAPTQVPGSVFNDLGADSNLYRKCLAFAEAVSSTRHRSRKSKKGDNLVHPNVTLDFMWAVESMVDILARFTSSSPVHRHLPIADFFREVPAAGGSMASPKVYGPAAEGASMVSIAIPDMTREQLIQLQDMTDRLVRGRELDSDGVYGKTPYASLTGRDMVKGDKAYVVPEKISYVFSVENMKKMLAYSKQQTKRGFRQESTKSETTGGSRDLQKTLEILIKVFETLEKSPEFGKGFSIQPSALFGQLLPAYAAMTDFVDGIPGPGNRSLLTAFPAEFAVSEFIMGKVDASRTLSTFASIVEALDFGLLPAYGYDAGGQYLRQIPPVSELAANIHEHANEVKGRKSSGDVKAEVVDLNKLSGYITRPSDRAPARMLGVFDATRGVAFEALVNMMRTHSGSAFRIAPDSNLPRRLEIDRSDEELAQAAKAVSAMAAEIMKMKPGISREEAAKTALQLYIESTSQAKPVKKAPAKKKPAPARKPTPVSATPVSATSVSDAEVSEIADRLEALFKLWNGSKVVKDGKGGFYIEANLRVDPNDPSERVYRTRVNVTVTRGVKPEFDLTSDKALMSLSAAVGVPFDELKADPAKASRLAADLVVAGRTSFARPEFSLSMDQLGKLLVANVSVDADEALREGADFHEAFHAAVGFAKIAGVFSDADIRELAKKYGKVTLDGRAWFNEDKAAEDYRKVLQGAVVAAREKENTPFGILQKFLAFVKSLVDALGGLIEQHDSDAYSAQGSKNPLTGLVFTGTISRSDRAEHTTVMDRKAKIRYAVERAILDAPDAFPGGVDNAVKVLAALPADDPAVVQLLEAYGPVPVAGDAQAPVVQGEFDFGEEVADNPRTDPSFVKPPAPEDDGVPYYVGPEVDNAPFLMLRPAIRSALDRGGVSRMAVPYGRLDALASAIGYAIREGATESAMNDVAGYILEADPRAVTRKDYYVDASQHRRMREAVRQLSAMYGVSPVSDSDQEKLLFRGLYELAAQGYALHGESRQHGPVADRAARKTSRTKLAAAVAVASGVTPGDILDAALRDLRAIAARRADSTLEKDIVSGRFIPALERLRAKASDPANLLAEFAPATDEGPTRHDPHRVFAMIEAGTKEVTDADGYRLGYSIDVDTESGNPFAAGNAKAYADHEGDPDFQAALATTLDALYTLAASRSMYADLGFRPGTPVFAEYANDIPTPLEALSDLSATPEQYEDPQFSALWDSDAPIISSASPELWLDSVIRPTFGSVAIRKLFQESNRQVAGLKLKIQSLRNLDDYTYGLNGNPGDALIAVDETYHGSGFRWKSGDIRHDVGRVEGVRRFDNLGKERAKDKRTGELIRNTRYDMRVHDLALKGRLAWLTGSRKLVTGVNELTFSLNDSADESHYTREAVMARVRGGRAGGESDFDLALERLDIQLADGADGGGGEWFDWIVDSGPGRYGLRERLVKGVCEALRAARAAYEAGDLALNEVNDFVIDRLDAANLVNGVQGHQPGHTGPVFTTAAVAIDVEELENLYLQSSSYKKLIAAGRKAEWLSRDAYLEPYRKLMREAKTLVASSPFLSEGAGRFFHSVASPLPYSRGDGITLYQVSRRVERDPVKAAAEVRTSFAEAFERGMDDRNPASSADSATLLMMREVFDLPWEDVETIRQRIKDGGYSEVRGLEIGPDSTVADLVARVEGRLENMVWNRAENYRGADKFGGPETVKDLVRVYRDRFAESAGVPFDVVHRTTGLLPANFQAGHAVQNMVDGLMNALAYRSSLVGILTAPDENGMPLCYAKPSERAAETTCVPDEVWGAIARWWGDLHGIAYDTAETGVENARRIYDEVVAKGGIDKRHFGSLNPEDMDDRTIEAFWARKGTPDGESTLSNIVGGYALGYAKHLFRSTKCMGLRWQSALIHRSWAYAKAMNVSFSLFFPWATRVESPIGAVGLAATTGGNISADFVRRNAEAVNKIFGRLGTAWITRDFVGEMDFAKMLDSNDPFLSEMYEFAAAIGLTMSTASVNPEENARGMLQEDLRNLVQFVRERFGDKAAKKVADISGALLTRASEKAFTYHLNATKLAVAAQLCMKLRADAARRGIAFDPIRDMKRYASYVNAEIGGIDPLQYAWAHPGMQNFMNTLFFSWQWTRGAWEAGGGKLIEQVLFGGHDIAPEERKYLIGRAARMYGWVAFGLPAMLQLLIKGLAVAIDPDHEDRDDEKWWIWENEDKAWMKSFDLTPIMRAVAKLFPKYADFRGNHPLLSAAAAAPFMLTRKAYFAPLALPVYTGKDPMNTSGGRHYYMHFAKQAWEFNRWFESPFNQFASKLAMPIQRIIEGVIGRSVTWMDHPLPWNKMHDAERWLSPTTDSALVNLLKAFVPFSLNGLTSYGDTGILPMLGPVSMGASGNASLDRLKDEVDAWASNDRRSYDFGRKVRARTRGGRHEKLHRAVGESEIVWRYVSEMLANGYSEGQARKMLDRALGDLKSERYRRIEKLLPETPDGDYDVREMERAVRQLHKLGVASKDLGKAIMGRLEESAAWKRRLTPEMRHRVSEILRESYDSSTAPRRERDY